MNVTTAAELLDFHGGGISCISEHAANEQLKGAVAIHNMLLESPVAYLADEVGMGKTYVALGTLALFRHFEPDFRVLVIAPRENIQKKWIKELKNFTLRNVRFSDQRVRGISGTPARPTIICNSLLELVRETVIDADRDFFTRLTSFSLPLTDDIEGWRGKRDQIREHVQWLEPGLFDLRNKQAFKDNFARAVNCALPQFDLVIFDEGHNLKGGFRKNSASRNRMLALAFGHPSERQQAVQAGFSGFGARAKRVLFLSATPLENDYSQLWNQLDVFGHASAAAILNNRSATDEDKRDTATKIMIRRVTSLPVAGKELTKNLYRREWRSGGVAIHDDALKIPDDKQKLVVALVQKKVTEVLGAKFNNSFQIGMLASFESFLETTGIRKKAEDDEPGVFDDPDQTDDPLRRTGVDVGSVNHLARSYRQKFGSELPHPKMDAVVARLSSSFVTGEKSLVFVRRVASVIELQRKLEEAYDEHLFNRLRLVLDSAVKRQLEAVITQYLEERKDVSRARYSREQSAGSDDESVVEPIIEDDTGGKETFFAWFFRGEGPPGILSGATLQRRFSQAGSVYSTFFEDNHVACLLGVTPHEEQKSVAAALAEYLDLPLSTLGETLDRRARLRLPRVKKQQRRNLFLAYQEAALALLAEDAGNLADKARIILEERYTLGETVLQGASRSPKLESWLDSPTFWTEIRERPPLRQALWPEAQLGDFRSSFREQELRRELLSAMSRLGNPFIDLYVLAVNRIGRLALRAREQADEIGGDLIADYLNLLATQQSEGGPVFSSFRELSEAAKNFDLIVTVNEPAARNEPLERATTIFGRLLRAQQPVGGMFGQVNETLVRQFRMPGYPLVLVTTDLLQEGEDLHTFCSSVHHYGISWMPSSMEQRVGRIDRVSSQTDRRLTALRSDPTGDQLLQVYYPHLRDTVEVLQVERVLERLNRFMLLMHEDFGGQETHGSEISTDDEMIREPREVKQIGRSLKSAFPIQEHLLRARQRRLAVDPGFADNIRKRFHSLRDRLDVDSTIKWEEPSSNQALFGTLALPRRYQPFTLLLRSVSGLTAIRCVSPIGLVDIDDHANEIQEAARDSGIRIGAVYDERFQSYNLTMEGDVLLGDENQDAERCRWLLHRVTVVADRLEHILLGIDQPMATFENDLQLEATYER